MSKPHPLTKRVLVVDDDADLVESFKILLESSGHRVACAYDGEEALQKAHDFQPEIILLDVELPIQGGWLVCAKLKLMKSPPKIVFVTGSTQPDLDQFAEFVQADSVLRKPFGMEQIERVIEICDELRASA